MAKKVKQKEMRAKYKLGDMVLYKKEILTINPVHNRQNYNGRTFFSFSSAVKEGKLESRKEEIVKVGEIISVTEKTESYSNVVISYKIKDTSHVTGGESPKYYHKDIISKVGD